MKSKLENSTITKNNFELDDSERQPCEIWSRVMGYHRPLSSYNIGKKSEFKERTYFKENKVGINSL